MEKEFIQFLKKNRVFTKFKNNTEKNYGFGFKEYLKDHLSCPGHYFMDAFPWHGDKSVEWAKLNDKWIKIVSGELD